MEAFVLMVAASLRAVDLKEVPPGAPTGDVGEP
jgi:hypothetical protein